MKQGLWRVNPDGNIETLQNPDSDGEMDDINEAQARSHVDHDEDALMMEP